MKSTIPIAVASRSFSKHPILRSELLERYKNVLFNDEGISLSGEALVNFTNGREKLIIGLEKIDEDILSKLPELKVISKYGVGTDMLDLEAMVKFEVKLGWTPGVNKRSVAELAIAFMISILRKIPQIYLDINNNVWKNIRGQQLSEKTVGIIGCGNIGKDLIGILRAFNCKILANDLLDFPDFYTTNNVEPVTIKEVLQRADIVSLHIPLNESTRGILNAERLRMMKPGAVLINTARGGLVDENELKKLLKSGALAGAAFDVFSNEPPDDFELLKLSNFIATPHIGGSSEEAVLAMGRAAIEGLDKNKIPDHNYSPRY
jgi:D-3-phosphoglycerate dehydrogenase